MDDTPIVVAAAALELFHAFALIHDDIMDGSDRRRGEPSVHRLFADLHTRSSWRGDPASYGRSTALLCGDLCAAWADQMFHECGLSADQVHQGYGVFANMRTEVIAGQYLDLVSGVGDGSVASALTVIRMKACPLHGDPAVADRGGAGRCRAGVARPRSPPSVIRSGTRSSSATTYSGSSVTRR